MDYFAPDELVLPEKGDLLISEPYLPDPNFERTVILLCEHDENGSFGFVVNKPSHAQLSELIDDLGSFDLPVFIGGPVQQNTLHFLHQNTVQMNNDRVISEGITWGIDFESLLHHINLGTVKEKEVKFFVGYSGWSEGQLLDELKAKSWIICKQPTQKMVFEVPPEQLWSHVLEQLGGKYRAISKYPTDPRLN